ncbi:MAG: hypothetical protein RIS86_1005 [Planctomycetota bacterium]|jgi:hypothetical protein
MSALPGAVLAWTPFLQPAPGVQHWWWLLVLPMALGVALSYKAIRTKELSRLPRDVAAMTLQIVAAVVGIAVGLHLLVIVLLPYLPAE